MSTLAIPVDEIEQMKGLAGLFPGEPAELFAKMLFGRGLGMGPAQSLSQIDFVKGKCELTANAQASRLRAYVGPWGERYDYEIVRLDNEACVLRFWRRWPDPARDDEKLGESSFSMEDARTAGIANGMYSKYARNMLLSRAMSNGVAWFAPETTYGIRVYAVGEIDPSREHPVPEIPASAETPSIATVTVPAPEARQLDAAPVETPAAAAEAAPAATVAAPPTEADAPRTPLGGEAAVHPGDGPPTREDFAELKRRCDAKGLSDQTINVLADGAKIPSGDTLRARFQRATRAQVINMIGNVQFVDPEPPANIPDADGQQTIDGTADDDRAGMPAPVEGVMGAQS